LRSLTEPEARLLDDPVDRAESFALLEAIHDSAHAPGPQLAALHRIVQEGRVGSMRLSGALQDAAPFVVHRSSALTRMSRRLSAAPPSTRREPVRRLHQARDFMRSGLGASLSLNANARAACLSPFHFHRNFLRSSERRRTSSSFVCGWSAPPTDYAGRIIQ